MKLAFTCTLEDFVEANRLHRRPDKSQAPRLADRLLFLWILLAVLAILIVSALAVGVYQGLSGSPAPPPGQRNWLVEAVAPWLPWLIAFGVIWFLICGSIAARERKALRWMFLLVAALPLIVNVVSIAVNGPPPAPATAPQAETRSAWVGLLPWIMVILIIWVSLFRYLRGAGRRMWEAQPQVALPQTLETTQRGLRFEDENCTHDYRWAAFPKWRESDRLFMLYVSEIMFHIIPKRAMATPAEVEEFRRLLEQHVASADRAARGFPVAPPAQPAPLSPMPLPPPPLPPPTRPQE